MIEAGHEVRQHPMPLCRSVHLPHSKVIAPSLIIRIFLLISRGNGYRLGACVIAVQGSVPAPLFCCLGGPARGLTAANPRAEAPPVIAASAVFTIIF